MAEFWVCEACKSLVRGTGAACYRCRAPRPAEARELAIGAPGAVLTPGVDAELQEVGFLLAKGHHVVSSRPLAVATILAVLGVLAVSVVGVGMTGYAGYAILAGHPRVLVSPDLLRLADSVDLMRSALFLVGLGLWLAFEGVTIHNAPLLGAGSPATPMWAALAWWFVPILNIVVPARVVADLHARLASRGSSSQLVVGAWWAAFVTASFLVPAILIVASVSLVGFGLAGIFGGRVALEPTLAGVSVGATAISLVQQLLFMAAGVAFIKVVADLDARQRARRRWLAEGRAHFEGRVAGSNDGPAPAPAEA